MDQAGTAKVETEAAQTEKGETLRDEARQGEIGKGEGEEAEREAEGAGEGKAGGMEVGGEAEGTGKGGGMEPVKLRDGRETARKEEEGREEMSAGRQGTGEDRQGTGEDRQGTGEDRQGTGEDRQGTGEGAAAVARLAEIYRGRPDVVPELIGGNTLAELDGALDKAQKAYRAVLERLGAVLPVGGGSTSAEVGTARVLPGVNAGGGDRFAGPEFGGSPNGGKGASGEVSYAGALAKIGRGISERGLTR